MSKERPSKTAPRPPFKPSFVSLGDIPGYKEAVAVERKNRMLAWFDVSQTVCGFEIMPLTPRRYLALQLANSPFVRAAQPTYQELAQFLWLMSPEYDNRNWWKSLRFSRRCRRAFAPVSRKLWQSRARWKKVEALKRERAAKLVTEIFKLVNQVFQDSPCGASDGKSYYNGIVSLVGVIARHYGWSESDIMRIPLARLFQYARECQERDSLNVALLTKTKYRNPLSNPSDSVTAEFCYNYGRKSLNGQN